MTSVEVCYCPSGRRDCGAGHQGRTTLVDAVIRKSGASHPILQPGKGLNFA
jgi:hypothetical protein